MSHRSPWFILGAAVVGIFAILGAVTFFGNITEGATAQEGGDKGGDNGGQTPTTNPPSNGNNGFQQCRVIHESLVDQWMNHVSSSGSHIHLQFYMGDDQPEYETLLPTAGVSGGRWNFGTTRVRGWVWEYADCTDQQVLEQIGAHIPRRVDGGAPNDGYVPWNETFLKPAGGNPHVPTASSSPSTSPSSGSGECSKATEKKLEVGNNHTVNGPAIVTVWTNRADAPPWGQKEVKVLVPSGTTLNILNAGGTAWEYPAGCSADQVKADFDKVSDKDAKSIDELKQYGLAK